MGDWIRFKNRQDLWGMDIGPEFVCMDDTIAFLDGLRHSEAQGPSAVLETAPEPA